MTSTNVTKPSQSSPVRAPDIFDAMRGEMDRLFERFEHGWPRYPAALFRGNGNEMMVLELDVHENGKQLTIEVDLPGVEEKDVTVTLANGVLTISGERRLEHEEKSENYCMAERQYGAFERSLRLPDTIDENNIEASFDKGVLKVTAQKRPEAVKAEKKIEIKSA